jgi:hypothetical protein
LIPVLFGANCKQSLHGVLSFWISPSLGLDYDRPAGRNWLAAFAVGQKGERPPQIASRRANIFCAVVSGRIPAGKKRRRLETKSIFKHY